MYQRLNNVNDYLRWRKTLTNRDSITRILDDPLIQERIENDLEILDDCYGAERSQDSGGYLAVVYGDRESVLNEAKDVIKPYYLDIEKYEFVDTYKTPEFHGVVEFRLFLCSGGDFSVELVMIIRE